MGRSDSLRNNDIYRILISGMKIKQTIMTLALMIGLGGLFVVPVAYAAECGGVQTSIINCDENNNPDNPNDNAIFGILRLIINILTAGVGLVAVGGLLWASYEYISNKGDAAAIKNAKDTITNVVLGLVAYAIMWSFLEFIIPGGIFSGGFSL
jgi:hypothetical protein